MIARRITEQLETRLHESPAVALIGPRQVGKTTLAHAVAAGRPSTYLDLESERDRAKLRDPELFLSGLADELVVFDEVHRAPELYRSLRGLIDDGRRSGKTNGRFLLLGSASSWACGTSSRNGRSSSIRAKNGIPSGNKSKPSASASLPPNWHRGGDDSTRPR